MIYVFHDSWKRGSDTSLLCTKLIQPFVLGWTVYAWLGWATIARAVMFRWWSSNQGARFSLDHVLGVRPSVWLVQRSHPV